MKRFNVYKTLCIATTILKSFGSWCAIGREGRKWKFRYLNERLKCMYTLVSVAEFGSIPILLADQSQTNRCWTYFSGIRRTVQFENRLQWYQVLEWTIYAILKIFHLKWPLSNSTSIPHSPIFILVPLFSRVVFKRKTLLWIVNYLHPDPVVYRRWIILQSHAYLVRISKSTSNNLFQGNFDDVGQANFKFIL